MGVLTIARECLCVCVGHRGGCLYEAGPPGGTRQGGSRPGAQAPPRPAGGGRPGPPAGQGGFYIAFT